MPLGHIQGIVRLDGVAEVMDERIVVGAHAKNITLFKIRTKDYVLFSIQSYRYQPA